MQLLGAFDGETFYLSDVLNIDMDAFRGNVQSATAQAFNLAFHAARQDHDVIGCDFKFAEFGFEQ